MSASSNSSLEKPPPEVGSGSGVLLEFPDWSGMLPCTPRMPADQWLAYCRSNLPKLRAKPGWQERRKDQNGVNVEFNL